MAHFLPTSLLDAPTLPHCVLPLLCLKVPPHTLIYFILQKHGTELISLFQALSHLVTSAGLGSPLAAMSQPPECPFPCPATLTGIDENQGRVEGNLILRKTQGTEEVGKVKDGADELAAACRSGDEESKPW